MDESLKKVSESLSQYKSGGIYSMKDIGAQVWEDANQRKQNAPVYEEFVLKKKKDQTMEAYFDTDLNGFVYEKNSSKLKKFVTNKRPQGFTTEIILRVVRIDDDDSWDVWENEIKYRSDFFGKDLKGFPKTEKVMNSKGKMEEVESTEALQEKRRSVLPKFGYCYRTEVEGTSTKFLYMFYKSMSNSFNEEYVELGGKQVHLIQTFRSQPVAFRIKFYISIIDQVLAYHDNGYVVADYFKISDLYFTDEKFNKGTMISKTVKTGEGVDAYWPNRICGIVSCYTAPEWITALLAGDSRSSSKLGNIYSLGMMIAEAEFDFFCFALEKGYNKYKSGKYWKNIQALVQSRSEMADGEDELVHFDNWLLNMVNPDPNSRIQNLHKAREQLMSMIGNNLDYSEAMDPDVPLVPVDECIIELENVDVNDEHFMAFQGFYNNPLKELASVQKSLKTDSSYQKSMSPDEFQSVQMGFETVKTNPDSIIMNSYSSKGFDRSVESSLKKSSMKDLNTGSFKISSKSQTYELNDHFSEAHESLMKYQSSHSQNLNAYQSNSQSLNMQSQQMGFETNKMISGKGNKSGYQSSYKSNMQSTMSSNKYASSQGNKYNSMSQKSQSYSSQKTGEFDTMKMSNQNTGGPQGINANRSMKKRDLEANADRDKIRII